MATLRDRLHEWASADDRWFHAGIAAKALGTTKGPIVQALNVLIRQHRIEKDMLNGRVIIFRAYKPGREKWQADAPTHLDVDHEPIPGLPTIDVVKKLRVARAQAESSDTFIQAVTFVLGEEFDGVRVKVGKRNWGRSKEAHRSSAAGKRGDSDV